MDNLEKNAYIDELCRYIDSKISRECDNIELVPNKILNKRPKYLYKYRACKDYNFKSLIEKNMFFRLPKNRPDLSDSIIKLDIRHDYKAMPKYFNGEVLEYYRKAMLKIIKGEKLGLNEIEELFSNKYKINIKEIKCSDFYEIDGVHSLKGTNINSLNNPDEMQQIERLFKEYITAKSIYDFYNSGNKLKSGLFISCFSERYDIPVQWERYADNSKGFCVEYQINEPRYFTCLYPVLYEEKKPITIEDFSSSLLQNKENSEKEFEIKKMKSILIKDPSYTSEEERRIIYLNNQLSAYHDDLFLPFDFVTAIYMGDKINKDDENKLKSISKQLNVPIYKRIYDKIYDSYFYKEIKNT